MQAELNPEIKEQLLNFYDEYKIPVLIGGSTLMAGITFLLVRSFFRKDREKKKATLGTLAKFGGKAFFSIMSSSKMLEYLKKAEVLKSVVNIEE